MKNLHISCNTVNCKIVRHFGNERVAMAASSVLVSLTLSRVLKHGGQVGHLVQYYVRGIRGLLMATRVFSTFQEQELVTKN